MPNTFIRKTPAPKCLYNIRFFCFNFIAFIFFMYLWSVMFFWIQFWYKSIYVELVLWPVRMQYNKLNDWVDSLDALQESKEEKKRVCITTTTMNSQKKPRLITLKTSVQNDVIVHYVMRTKMSVFQSTFEATRHKEIFVEKDSTNETNYKLWTELMLNRKNERTKKENNLNIHAISSTLQFHVHGSTQWRTHTFLFSLQVLCKITNFRLKGHLIILIAVEKRTILIEIGQEGEGDVKVDARWCENRWNPFPKKKIRNDTNNNANYVSFFV